MTRDQALRVLREQMPTVAREFGVAHLSLFGSVARDASTSASDVDVLVEFAPGARYGYFLLYRLQRQMEIALGVPVDLVTLAGLRSEIRDEVLREAVRAA